MSNQAQTITPPYSLTQNLSFRPWLIWGLGCLFYFYEFFLQVSPGAMYNELVRDFTITASQWGLLAGIYFWSYALMQIPGGVLLDRFGPRKLLSTAAAICAVGSLLFSITDSFAMVSLARFFIGLGSAFAAIGTLKLAANWFPANRFAFLVGLTLTIGMLGAVIGEGPLAVVVDLFQWRPTMFALGLIGLGVTFILFTVVRDNPINAVQEATSESQLSLTAGLLKIISNKQIWLTALYGGLVFTPVLAFAGPAWGVPFLMLKYGVTKPEANALVSTIFIGFAVGSPIGGWLSDKIAKRLPPMIIGAIGALLFLTLVIYTVNLPLSILSILLFSFGFFASGFLPAFSVIRERSPQQCSATALGFMNMMNMLGAAIVPHVIGVFLDSIWDGSLDGAVRVYSLADYQWALAILPVSLVIAVLLLPFIKETHGRISEN